MQIARTAEQIGGTESREQRKDASGIDVGARILAMARAAAAMHMSMATPDRAADGHTHGGRTTPIAGAMSAGGTR